MGLFLCRKPHTPLRPFAVRKVPRLRAEGTPSLLRKVCFYGRHLPHQNPLQAIFARKVPNKKTDLPQNTQGPSAAGRGTFRNSIPLPKTGTLRCAAPVPCHIQYFHPISSPTILTLPVLSLHPLTSRPLIPHVLSTPSTHFPHAHSPYSLPHTSSNAHPFFCQAHGRGSAFRFKTPVRPSQIN